MKQIGVALIALTFATVLAAAPARTTRSSAAARDTCGCVAPDGSCTASGSCGGRCTAQCPSGGCSVKCSGFRDFYETEVTMRMENGTSRKLLAELARLTGKSMSFSSARPDVPFNLEVSRASVWDLLEILSDTGTVTVEGEDFENLKTTRRAMVNGERLSLAARGVTAGEYVAHLALLSGLPLRVASGDPSAPLNFNLENVTLTEVLNKVSEETGVEIVNDEDEEDDAGGR